MGSGKVPVDLNVPADPAQKKSNGNQELRSLTVSSDASLQRDSETSSPLVAGPEPAIPRLHSEGLSVLSSKTKQPAFSAASLWIRKARDARFGVHSDVANAILERLTAVGASLEALPSVVVIVAHPDDEAIGAGAILKGLPDAHVIHLTDGAPRDPEYAMRKGFPSRAAYAQARRDEVTAALWIIGIPPERIHGLQFVDGEAAFHLVEVTQRLVDLLAALKPDVVLTHPYEGGHSDHDSTAFAVHLACGILKREGMPAPILMELTSYHNFGGRRRLFNFLPHPKLVVKTVQLSDEDREIKRQMFDAFTSQHELLKSFPLEVERFRHAPRYLFTVPPHEGTLDYERLCTKMTGAEWRAEAEKALEELRAQKLFFSGIRADQ